MAMPAQPPKRWPADEARRLNEVSDELRTRIRDGTEIVVDVEGFFARVWGDATSLP